jgi:hypothetical protein
MSPLGLLYKNRLMAPFLDSAFSSISTFLLKTIVDPASGLGKTKIGFASQ